MPRRVIAELEARAAHEREGAADGVNLLTLHRAKGLEWDAVFLPSLEEGTLPIRQAKEDDDALAEERRLLYVGHHARPAAPRPLLGGAAREPRSRGAPPAEPVPARPASARRDEDHPAGRPARPRNGCGGAATRTTRCSRPCAPGGPRQARQEAMPPYVIAHDATLLAIAEARPRTMAGLRRVKGMGPAKLEKYGEELLAVIEAALGRLDSRRSRLRPPGPASGTPPAQPSQPASATSANMAMSPAGSVPSSISSVVRKWSQALTGSEPRPVGADLGHDEDEVHRRPARRPRSPTPARGSASPRRAAWSPRRSRTRTATTGSPPAANRPASKSPPTSCPTTQTPPTVRHREHGHRDRLADDRGREVPDPRHGRRQRQVQEPAVEVRRDRASRAGAPATAAMIGHSQDEM